MKLWELEKKKRQNSNKRPLTRSMIFMLIVGWLLPVTLIAMGILFLASSVLNRQIERTIVTSTDKAVEICEMKLREIMTASKNASYTQTIRNSYYEYLDTGDEQTLYTNITYFLNQQYKYDESMLCTLVFLLREPGQIYYTYNTYQENNQGLDGYSRVTFFQENVLPTVKQMSTELATNTMLVGQEEHVYMVRNLVDSSFRPYAMIVIELNPVNVFGSMESVWGARDYQVYLEGEPLAVTTFPANFDVTKLGQEDEILRNIAGEGTVASYSYKTSEFGGQNMIYVSQIDESTLVDELKMMRNTLLLVLISLIPLLLMMYQFFYRKVSRPVRELVKATEAISEGNFGHSITNYASSAEFDYLQRNFNAMSEELKFQFETIYKEELALKDANIKALQSQINPHFLNNTLEIINWEARMCGADNVSGMIEALGTMLRATMNRKQRRFVTLAEELSYVDAYLYIISMRFGERFKVYRQIDESLLQMEVPILIIQPIVENAVEHGVEENKEGMVRLRIMSDWDKIIIDVINDGVLSERDKERIAFLLEGDELDDNEHHVSLGIRNVNRRIKIIYGEDCGLTITDDEEDNTISRIVVKMTHESSFPSS
ncbi:MAG: histidine kinase [Lachnospiraceae bacterium]|nr:histidine kinase [Lachnospiraceae bacterium]